MYLNKDGNIAGPFNIGDVKSQIRAGLLQPDVLAREDETQNWVHLSEMPSLRAAPLKPNLEATQVTYKPSALPQLANDRPYAGFWLRFFAFFIDSIILSIPIAVIYGITYFALYASLYDPSDENNAALGVASLFASVWLSLITGLLGTLYYATMESSRLQASLGKLALGLKVTDLQGGRISFWRAFGRELAKTVSILTFYIGFIMIAFTDRKQALHDIMASTLVVSAKQA